MLWQHPCIPFLLNFLFWEVSLKSAIPFLRLGAKFEQEALLQIQEKAYHHIAGA
jgi:hypothetical protein